MQTIFREYDIRGIYPTELTQESVRAIGFLLGERVRARGGKYLAIGHDARTHSRELFAWLSEGVAGADIEILDLGLIPTPVAYFSLFNSFEGITPDGSVMITGSHNPPEYNGFKITLFKEPFFGEAITALGEEAQKLIEAKISCSKPPKIHFADALGRYITYMKEEFKALSSLSVPLSIDCGNGVAGVALEPILKGLNLECEVLYGEPDGRFPNHHPDPSDPHNLEDLQALLKKRGGLGFAFDGDADRIAVLTPKYIFKGDELAVIFAKQMKNPLVIGEVKCSMSMYEEINKIGQAVMYKTGHSNLKVKLKELGAHLAAEVSGHLFFNDRYFGYDDAIYAALRTMELALWGINLDLEKESLPPLFSTEELKVKTTEEKKFPLMERIKALLLEKKESLPPILEVIDVDGIRVVFEEGWGLVRASNTTPVLVTRFEAKSQEKLALYQESLEALIRQAQQEQN
ncbi:phosphomannomutase/phosphoglucomutase [Wolinella succinogenes]|uniref:phosphomannomutase/phosphoglucomutase n=1 Tax=Wolinella succinogenes TaxID=844 RepID=UPI00240A97F2|nr:phosphomannomutase/phosphoglucomutase [Wolinella succinogenes]